MKILVTGFESFGGMVANPTESLAKEVADFDFAGAILYSAILPVHYDECVERIVQSIKEIGPDVIISCGLSAGRTAVTPERIGINIKDTSMLNPIPDNRGKKPLDELIDPQGPDALFSTLPNRQIVQNLLSSGIPSHISNTAGTYICNNTLYGVLNYIRENELKIKAGFIHFPASTDLAVHRLDIPSMPYATMVDSLKIIIQTVIEELSLKTEETAYI